MPAQLAKKNHPSILLHGVDFTSAPRSKKGITIASGRLLGDIFHLQSLTTLYDFAAFSAWLKLPGPWLGGFDFPFSFPRELVTQLGWPQQWAELITHIATLPRATLREKFKALACLPRCVAHDLQKETPKQRIAAPAFVFKSRSMRSRRIP